MNEILIGTCSWNYHSWEGLVYSGRKNTAAEYLPEYAQKYRTVEIDSWFYKIPARREVLEYVSRVPQGFRFTCKVPADLTLTHKRSFDQPGPLVANDHFLSVDLFATFLDAINPMLPCIDALIFEFEYLNHEKMPSPDLFLQRLDSFVKQCGADLPIAIETRNKNYLSEAYFGFLDERKLMHVFSEKIYMPPVYKVYEQFGRHINRRPLIRLLGGDRKEIEARTRENWNRIVVPREDKNRIVAMAGDIVRRGHGVTINVNNHYEGSAPLTIKSLYELMAGEAG